MTKAYTGVYLGKRLTECLRKYGIDNNILGIVCDNASNNGPMIMTLSTTLPNFRGATYHIMCFAHILNLVIKFS
ncbi:hypothetical protein JAAARDRAFT_433173 [Jaapia argillacea MUCL 33604]|uniref:DUF659 domain-containing protein n=1 Tax=Jaapia argillacea MUCL 33604 TaxID=933084 RepID=A0A067PSN3_9AGAM|nr:hypothetical protein JAAARDRAFT_433173 [Jaapia argillacea MUCL 33604]